MDILAEINYLANAKAALPSSAASDSFKPDRRIFTLLRYRLSEFSSNARRMEGTRCLKAFATPPKRIIASGSEKVRKSEHT